VPTGLTNAAGVAAGFQPQPGGGEQPAGPQRHRPGSYGYFNKRSGHPLSGTDTKMISWASHSAAAERWQLIQYTPPPWTASPAQQRGVDPLGRVIYVPAPDGVGLPNTTFKFMPMMANSTLLKPQ